MECIMLSRKAWQRLFPGMENSKATYNAYKANCTMPLPDIFAPTICTSVPCQEGNNPMSMFDEDLCYSRPITRCAPVQAAGATAINVTTAPEVPEVNQRKYLNDRAYNVKCDKIDQLQEQFFILEPKGPTNPTELAAALKAGDYTILTKDSDGDEWEEDEYFYWRNWFSWRTPTTQPDKKGYAAAVKEFTKFYMDQVDLIRIASPADGLAALQALKDWKPAATPVVVPAA